MTGVARASSSLAPYLSATTHTVPSVTRPLVVEFPKSTAKIVSQGRPLANSNYSMAQVFLPKSRAWVYTKATFGLTSAAQIRTAHTDIQFPDFSAYRRAPVKGAEKDQEATADSRKTFSYLLLAAGAVPATYATKVLVQEFVLSMSATADVLALAKVEIKLSDIPEGKSVTFKWRGKPLFVRHRTAEEIGREQSVDTSTLRHQEHDNDRVQRPEWLVLLGVCTHLGCVPVANQGEFGGYYCPCHGSHYDASGRIRKGPAPLNLEGLNPVLIRTMSSQMNQFKTAGNIIRRTRQTEQMRQTDRVIRKTQRDLERERHDLERQEKKLEMEIKQAAKQGNKEALTVLAKQLVNLRKQKTKTFAVGSKVQSIGTQGRLMQSNMKMADAMATTTKSMAAMNKVMDPQKTAATMKEFERQSARMDMTEEMINDTLDDILDESGDEEEQDAIVTQVLDEIGIEISGKMLDAPSAHKGALGSQSKTEISDDDIERQLAQLKAL